MLFHQTSSFFKPVVIWRFRCRTVHHRRWREGLGRRRWQQLLPGAWWVASTQLSKEYEGYCQESSCGKKSIGVRFGIVVTWWHQLASVFIGIELKIRYLKLPSFSKSSSPASRAKAHCKEHLFHGLSRMTVIISRRHRPEPWHRGLSALARTQPRSPRWLRRRQTRSDTSTEAGLFQGNLARLYSETD